MKLLSVGLTGVSNDITAKLRQDCGAFLPEGFRIAVDEINKGKYTFIGCNIVEGELSFRNYERVKDSLKSYISRIVADVIMVREEKVLVRHLIEKNYGYFSVEEQNLIYDNALKMLNSAIGITDDFAPAARRNKIITKLSEYLDQHHELVVDGFIQFRLKDYRDNLAQIVDRAVDDLMLELEYKEFIRVLRYFVNVQEARVSEVHVLIKDKDSYRIIDQDGKTISNQYLETFASQYTEDINYEDLLITALITIAPQNVVLHSPHNEATKDVVETIKNIFEDRIAFCSGCEICLSAIDI